ncbi:hypothetical protein ACFV8T_34630 [Streptomyces sp. NPDC059832]|uniref:hypothetical protein n=1 Tax=Streptomyces sp. NPDC059832 TaxID=3346966 RepID=UPI003658D93E
MTGVTAGFTTSDLDDLLAGLDRHTADHQEEPSVAPAACRPLEENQAPRLSSRR